MKKIILTSLSLTPLMAFGQATASGTLFGSVFMFLLAIGISIIVFLVLRQLFLWYWKIEIILKKQDEQTNILTSIYNSIEENNRLTKSQNDSNTPK